ncbi:hypothetical protein F4679DRAFT_572603 [Xylaria curta]|nr:hypothetical protein F4679DRAFT_572603 [Xylaria curta]
MAILTKFVEGRIGRNFPSLRISRSIRAGYLMLLSLFASRATTWVNLTSSTHNNLSVPPVSENAHAGLDLIMQPQGTMLSTRESGLEGVFHFEQDEIRPMMVSESSERERSSRNSSNTTHQKKPNMKLPVSWWWWWEIGATILSIASLVLLFILFFKSDSQPLQSWPLQIQPSFLVAFLATIAKKSMMVPVASCLSQLKWRHFMHRPRPLDQFQVIDDASRGPWGSLIFLMSGFKIRAFLPLSLAFVTVVGLGFEPSAQQILQFPEGTSILANVSAEVGIATEYSSNAFGPITVDLFHLRSSIIDLISGVVLGTNFNCPSNYCTWEDFTTLGICSQSLTSEIEMSCDDPENPRLNCTYMFPGENRSTIAGNITLGHYLSRNGTKSFRLWFESTQTQNEIGILSAVKVTHLYPDPSPTETSSSRLYWCAQTFRNVTATSSQLSHGSIVKEELQLIDVQTEGGYYTFSSSSAGTNFTIDVDSTLYLTDHLRILLTQTVGDVESHSPYLYTTDFRNFTTNLATMLSNQIRSTNPGDNKNATMLRGTAYTKEIYIHVCWRWAILPTAAVFITSILLTCAILTNMKHPLFKSSALALLFHGLDHDLVGVHIDQLGTAERIKHAAKGIRVRLAAGREDPFLKFRRQE